MRWQYTQRWLATSILNLDDPVCLWAGELRMWNDSMNRWEPADEATQLACRLDGRIEPCP